MTRSAEIYKTESPMRYAFLWLLGVPIPILIVIWLLFH